MKPFRILYFIAALGMFGSSGANAEIVLDYEDVRRLVTIAYEPVWAIGTGLTATPDDAEAVHRMIRTTLSGLYDVELAEAVRIQYGGSVNATNAKDLFAQPNIYGGLIGGASLRPNDFTAIVKAASAN